MFKPTRGAQRPSKTTHGINPFALIKFLESAKTRCEQEGDRDSALRFELMVEYFRNDYEPGKPLKFTGGVIGF